MHAAVQGPLQPPPSPLSQPLLTCQAAVQPPQIPLPRPFAPAMLLSLMTVHRSATDVQTRCRPVAHSCASPPPNPLFPPPPRPLLPPSCRLLSPIMLCRSVTDLRPRKLDVEQCTLLCNLAELVSRGLEVNSSYIRDSLNSPQNTAEGSSPSGTAATPPM